MKWKQNGRPSDHHNPYSLECFVCIPIHLITIQNRKCTPLNLRMSENRGCKTNKLKTSKKKKTCFIEELTVENELPI